MRTYGRVLADDGQSMVWKVVETEPNGSNDLVYTTALCQTIKLNISESPFYAQHGIPAKPSVVQQLAPDYYACLCQQRYAQHFANLLIAKVPSDDPADPTPAYRLDITTHQGTKINATVPVPI